MPEKQLVITKEYAPAPTTLRQRVSRHIQNDDILESDIELAYGGVVDELSSAQQQIDILSECLKVAAEVLRLIHMNNSLGKRHLAIGYLLGYIQKRPYMVTEDALVKVRKVLVALFPNEASERTKWDRIRHLKAPAIYRRDGYKCFYCGMRVNLSIDHVVPVSKGGSHDDSNLVTCCRECNSSKGDLTIAQWDAAKRRSI